MGGYVNSQDTPHERRAGSGVASGWVVRVVGVKNTTGFRRGCGMDIGFGGALEPEVMSL